MPSNILKLSLLYIITIIFTITNLNSVSAFGSNAFLPLLEVMMIYYFAVHKNNIFGFWFIFFIGILSDSLNGLPIGVTSLIYLSMVKLFTFIGQKQTPKEDFPSILKEFFFFICAILILKWLILSIYYKNIYNITPFIAQIIISSITYVIIHRFCDFLCRKIIKDY